MSSKKQGDSSYEEEVSESLTPLGEKVEQLHVTPKQSKAKAKPANLSHSTVDVFRSCSYDKSCYVLNMLQRLGYLSPPLRPRLTLLQLGHAREMIANAVEVWVISFGMQLYSIGSNEFNLCFSRIQNLGDPRFKWNLKSSQIDKLFQLISTPLLGESSKATVTLPEFCLAFLWLGPPQAKCPVTPSQAVIRAHTHVSNIQKSFDEIETYVGFSSLLANERKLCNKSSNIIYSLQEGTVVLADGSLKTTYAIRNLVRSVHQQNKEFEHSLVFEDNSGANLGMSSTYTKRNIRPVIPQFVPVRVSGLGLDLASPPPRSFQGSVITPPVPSTGAFTVSMNPFSQGVPKAPTPGSYPPSGMGLMFEPFRDNRPPSPPRMSDHVFPWELGEH